MVEVESEFAKVRKEQTAFYTKKKKQDRRDLDIKLDTLTTSRNELWQIQIAVEQNELKISKEKLEHEREKQKLEIENLKAVDRRQEIHLLSVQKLKLEIQKEICERA